MRLHHYQNTVSLRTAEKSEIEWINRCYDDVQVQFVHSNYDKEIIAIAELGGQKAGLGRLVTVDEKHLELGGMYVFEPYRGKGVAKQIVQFLLERVKPFQTVYCIPFKHLIPFYKQSGFVQPSHFESVPRELLQKYQWCQDKYSNPTALLVLESRAQT